MIIHPTLLAAAAMAATLLGAPAALACTTVRTVTFQVDPRASIVVFAVNSSDTQPVAGAASLLIDAELLADLQASVAAGCERTMTHTAWGELWVMGDAAARYAVTTELRGVRPSTGKSALIKKWSDAKSVPGSYSHQHIMKFKDQWVRQARVGDLLSLTAYGEVAAASLSPSTFNQAYSYYTWGLADVVPVLTIGLP